MNSCLAQVSGKQFYVGDVIILSLVLKAHTVTCFIGLRFHASQNIPKHEEYEGVSSSVSSSFYAPNQLKFTTYDDCMRIFFSIYISFVKCKYFSLVVFIFC